MKWFRHSLRLLKIFFRKEINHPFDFIKISALENRNIQELKNELSSFVEQMKSEEGNVVITNQRHFEALQRSLDAVNRVKRSGFFSDYYRTPRLRTPKRYRIPW